MNPRDTQFTEFAKLLFEELQAIELEGLRNNWNNLDVYRRQREAIARRSHDFACHTIRSQAQGMALLCLYDPEWMKERVELVPDMVELPKDAQ